MKVNFITSDPDRVVEIIQAINEGERSKWTDGVTKTWDGFWDDGIITPRKSGGNYTCIVTEQYQYLLTDEERENNLF